VVTVALARPRFMAIITFILRTAGISEFPKTSPTRGASSHGRSEDSPMRSLILGVLAFSALPAQSLAQEMSAQAGSDAIQRLVDIAAVPCLPGENPAPTPPSPLPYDGPLLTRQNLTGDWLGSRDSLREHGVTWDIYSTNFYQGVASGGLQDNSQFAGRADYYLNIDGQKAGLWEGLFINLHGETTFGQSVNSSTGTLLPVNLSQLVPVPNQDVTALTRVKVTQALSENFIVFGGKLNLLDEFNQPFTGGARGVNGFMNAGLLFNPVLARTVPYSTFGAGAAYLKNMQLVASVLVLDTANTPTTTGFERFFQNGVSVVGQLNMQTSFFNLPGHQGGGFSYSNGQYAALDTTAFIVLARLQQNLPAFARQSGSWSLFYAFDQALWVSSENPSRSWGAFGNLGLSDGNPNPIRWTGNIGFGGASPIASRKLDSFGMGFFYVGLSDNIKNFAPRALPLRDEHGVELFYNIGVTPWCHITPDFQVVLPGQAQASTVLALALRAKIDF